MTRAERQQTTGPETIDTPTAKPISSPSTAEGPGDRAQAKRRLQVRHYSRAGALAATAALSLVATGGLVSAQGRSTDVLGPRPIVLPPRPTTPPTTAPAGRPRGRTGAGTKPPVPRVLSITPRNGTHDVGLLAPISVRLSGPPRPAAPQPVLEPPVSGTWSRHGNTLRFNPSGGYGPWRTEVVTVPKGLASPVKSQFNVEGVGTARTEQLLAELGYIPLRFGATRYTSSLRLEAHLPALVSPVPRPGRFAWRYPNVPTSLSALWSPSEYNVILQGAIMSFEQQQGLTVDGVMGPLVWNALARAVAKRQLDPLPYDYLMVSEAVPESLAVWRDGHDSYETPVNTGVNGANTPVGTWPVYSRFETTTMIGTDVDGAHYDVPNVPWVAYFNGGDAVHGYWRYSYGYPQSNGCVELPVGNAQVVWAMDPIGTLVNVGG